MFNQVILIGNIGSITEKQKANGESFASLSIATEHFAGRGDDGKAKKDTTWHRVFCYGKRAGPMLDFCQKGDRIMVQGPLCYFKDDDGKSTGAFVVAYDWKLLHSRGDGERPRRQRSAPPAKRKADPEAYVDEEIGMEFDDAAPVEVEDEVPY